MPGLDNCIYKHVVIVTAQRTGSMKIFLFSVDEKMIVFDMFQCRKEYIEVESFLTKKNIAAREIFLIK